MKYQHPIEMFFSNHHPLAKGLSADFTGSLGGNVKLLLDAPHVFDGGKGTMHSGFATIVLDSIMGGAVMGMLEKLQPIATVGISIHQLRKARVGEAIKGVACCTRVHNDIAYVTGELTSGEEKIAIASGTFMIGTRGTSIREKQVESRI